MTMLWESLPKSYQDMLWLGGSMFHLGEGTNNVRVTDMFEARVYV